MHWKCQHTVLHCQPSSSCSRDRRNIQGDNPGPGFLLAMPCFHACHTTGCAATAQPALTSSWWKSAWETQQPLLFPSSELTQEECESTCKQHRYSQLNVCGFPYCFRTFCVYYMSTFIAAFKEDKSAIYCEEGMAAKFVSSRTSAVARRYQTQVWTPNSDSVAWYVDVHKFHVQHMSVYTQPQQLSFHLWALLSTSVNRMMGSLLHGTFGVLHWEVQWKLRVMSMIE